MEQIVAIDKVTECYEFTHYYIRAYQVMILRSVVVSLLKNKKFQVLKKLQIFFKITIKRILNL